MRLRVLLAASLLAAAAPLASRAQTTATTPRFYAGVGASLFSNKPFVKRNASTIVGPALTAGVRLSPRWAVQVGASLAWLTKDSMSTSPVVQTFEAHTATLMVPVLVRYTFAPAPKRFHLEALAGLTVLRAASRATYTATPPVAAGPPVSKEVRSNVITGNISLGPGVRYTLTPHVELTAHALVNAVIGYSLAHFTDRAFLNAQVGAHYTFG